MIELTVYNYLKSVLTCPVCVERREDIERYAYIEKTATNGKNRLYGCTIAVQSYGESFQEALELNEEVKQAMENIVELDEIAGCKLVTDYKFDDLTRKKHRYQALFDIAHY